MIPRFKYSFLVTLVGFSAAGGWREAAAQSNTVVQTFYAIGLQHAQSYPYNFTGRVFSFNDVEAEIGSGTLLRRHTVLTAGHIVYNSTTGFDTNVSFSRGLYGNYSFSEQQVTGVVALSGYQAAVAANLTAATGTETIEEAERDMGLLLVTDPPVDGNWGNYLADPTQLTNNDGRFILGYPGVTFDGRTMAYAVPLDPFVQIGLGETGAYNNDLVVLEPGFSGGPVYAVVNKEQVVVAEFTSSDEDTTGEFNIEGARAIDTEAAKFIQDAEYNAGLIKKVKISGPTIATRGKTLTYTLTVKFTEPNVDGSQATTNRYPELKLKSDSAGTSTQPLVTITKISNTQFKVFFSTALRPGATVHLMGFYDKGMQAPNSDFAVLLQ